MSKRSFLFLITTLIASIGSADSKIVEQAESEKKIDILAGTIPGLKINNILTSQIELVEGKEIIISHIEIPANTTLPKHWHPGEEYVYVLEGSVVLWQKGKPDVPLKKGDVFKVSAKQIHTAVTDEEGLTGLIFRVHETGQPGRVNVEQ